MRIGIPAALAASTTWATLSGPPMFPGLIRTAWTPASIARSARLALKWMSAITGIGESRTIRFRASASWIFGTAQRTTSQPAEASAAICAVVAVTSRVGVEGHRLDDNWRAAADLDVAYLDAAFARHTARSVAPDQEGATDDHVCEPDAEVGHDRRPNRPAVAARAKLEAVG